MSCDLLPSSAPGNHYQGDVRDMLCLPWDLAILHPSCTFLCSSGLHWNKNPASPRFGGRQTEEALDFVRYLESAEVRRKVKRVGIENPAGCIGTKIRPANQYVQPYEFGDDASKKTGLWLHNLPVLKIDPARRCAGRLVEWPRGSGKIVERWANQTDSGQNNLGPSANRWQLRSETYDGIADAMAEQWGAL